MSKRELHSSTGLSESDWLRPRLRPFLGTVASIVPDGFAAYVRILHPSRGPHNRFSTWASVAARSGRTMHRLVQFHAIERPGLSSSTADSPSKEDGGMVNPLATIIDTPDNGNLRPNLLTALCQVLAEHTNTKDRCFFCIWEGHGWLPGNSSGGELVFTAPADTLHDLTSTLVRPSPVPPPFPTEPKNQCKIDLPFRSYFLFEGPLNAANQFGWTLAEDCFVPESPNLFWPSDRTWCVASEIDLYCTLVAGSEALVEGLLAQPQLETWRVFPEDPVTYGSDKINT